MRKFVIPGNYSHNIVQSNTNFLQSASTRSSPNGDCVLSEMGIYRDNLSAIVIGDNFLWIIVIAQNSLDLSIIVIAFVIYFVIADKLSR